MHSILPNLSFIGAHNCPQIDKPPLQNSLNFGGEEKCAEYSSQLLLCNKQAYKKSQWHMTRSLYLAPASAGQLHASIAQLEFECCKWGMTEPLFFECLGKLYLSLQSFGSYPATHPGHVFIMEVACLYHGSGTCTRGKTPLQLPALCPIR